MWPSGLTLVMTLAVTLALNFQGQIWILLYLNQNYPIAMKQKANILIELQALNVTIRFDLCHDLERCGVRIYQIVTGVTSDVDVPLTRLVILIVIFLVGDFFQIYEMLVMETKPGNAVSIIETDMNVSTYHSIAFYD